MPQAAAASTQLCVETSQNPLSFFNPCAQPPPRGCVLKLRIKKVMLSMVIAAVFGWLCVETSKSRLRKWCLVQPPSRGCVLKLRLNQGQ